MVETWIIWGTITLVTALIGTLIALKIQYRYLARMHIQQEAWEHAQEGNERNWEVWQEKRSLEIEKKLTDQVQQIQNEWQEWETRDAARIAAINLEHELAMLPFLEEMQLPQSVNGQRQFSSTRWQPAMLAGADLHQRDLSHHYIGRANMRDANLVGANLSMADLSEACLAGANLSGANLAGADLGNADLRNATLTGANLRVADLHNAILVGANLVGACNLTIKQLYSAIYDSTTRLDPEIDLTVPRIPSILPKIATSPLPPPESPSAHPALENNGIKVTQSLFLDERAIPIQRRLHTPLLLPLTVDDRARVRSLHSNP